MVIFHSYVKLPEGIQKITELYDSTLLYTLQGPSCQLPESTLCKCKLSKHTPSKSSCGSISGFSNDTTKCGSRAWYHRVSSHTQNAQTELGSSSQVKFEKVPPPIVSNYTGIEWEWISTGHYYIVIILSASSKTKHL